MAELKHPIPQHFVDFCKEVGKLAEKHNFRSVSFQIESSVFESWPRQVNGSWTNGRHGDTAHLIKVSSSVDIVEDIRQETAE